MIPVDILANPDLSPTAKLVCGVMGLEAYGSGEVAISLQAIAKLCGCSSRSTILNALEQLRDAKLIEPFGSPVRQVQPYKLLHSRFKPKEAKENISISSKYPVSVGSRDLVRCGKCGLRCKQLLKVGWCRACNWKLKVQGVVREELAKVAS